MKNWDWSLIGIVGVIILAAFGGAKNTGLAPNPSSTNQTSSVPQVSERQLSQAEIESQIITAQYKANELQRQLAIEQDKKNSSQYKGMISMNTYTSYDAQYEYIDIYANYSNKEPINITGWKILSTSTNQSAIIPQTTSLYFSGQINTTEDVYLKPGEHAYIITGSSPTGYGLKTNLCSGYLSQYNIFYPSISGNCPAPRNEDTSAIPRRIVNDNCFDLINSLPSCRVPAALSSNYSYECQDFITQKINYSSCVSIHKNDKDFWGNTWYVYLKRSQPLWQYSRTTMILYDTLGKPVVTQVRY